MGKIRLFAILEDMGTNKIIILTTAALVLISSLIILGFLKKPAASVQEISEGIKIVKTWELPKELNEISGFTFLDGSRIACVQDEQGVIFIFNLTTKKLEKQITFEGSGDYEGIALHEGTAYVVKSNGTIYEVKNFMGKLKLQKHQTSLSSSNDVEGICYDKGRNGLLITVKEKDPKSRSYKGIYLFDLQQKQLKSAPAIKLTFEEAEFDNIRDKDVQKIFKPSEIALNSKGDIFLIEGERPKLLIMNSSGKAKKLFTLDDDDFPQPEGIAFDPKGDVYISNEGKPGTIHLVSIP